MPSTFWEDIKKTVKEGVTVAAEKTEEYTKIGKIKVEILNVNRHLDKLHAELGRAVFDLIEKKKKVGAGTDEQVDGLMKSINEQKALLKEKEDAIEAIKEEAKGEESAEAEEKVDEVEPETKSKEKPKKS